MKTCNCVNCQFNRPHPNPILEKEMGWIRDLYNRVSFALTIAFARQAASEATFMKPVPEPAPKPSAADYLWDQSLINPRGNREVRL